MHHAHITHLIEQAAARLEANAEVTFSSYTSNGQWPAECESEQAEYERDIDLINSLREALPELTAVHRVRIGLEQLLRGHRVRGTQIRYQDLAALLPETTKGTT